MELEFRQFREADFGALAGWVPDAAAAVQWGGPYVGFPITRALLEIFLDQEAGRLPKRRCWTALDRQSGEPVGHFQLAFDWTIAQATLCRVILAPKARGRGLAGPLVDRAIDEAFRYPQIHRLELRVYDFNTAAMRAYQRCGFVREGVLRQSVVVGDERRNTAIMSILRPERIGPSETS